MAVQNAGTVPWEGYSLRRIDVSLSLDDCQTVAFVPIESTEPGDFVDVPTDVMVPDEPGLCFARFKMTDADRVDAFPSDAVLRSKSSWNSLNCYDAISFVSHPGDQVVCVVRTADRVAQEVGARLGPGEVLLGRMSQARRHRHRPCPRAVHREFAGRPQERGDHLPLGGRAGSRRQRGTSRRCVASVDGACPTSGPKVGHLGAGGDHPRRQGGRSIYGAWGNPGPRGCWPQVSEGTFTYDNRTGRPPGRFVSALSRVLPGVARVWSQAEPYADAWREHNLAALRRPGRRWIVLGDSMSLGVGASAYDLGWVGQLADRLAADGHDLQVINLSSTGARVRDVIDQQLPVLSALGSHGDDLVTVMVGSNDLFAGRVPRTALPSAYAELVGMVPKRSVVATLTQPPSAAVRANEHVERGAASGAIVMVDLRVTGPSSWKGRLAPDLFHPNDSGYAAIATAFEPTVRGLLDA